MSPVVGMLEILSLWMLQCMCKEKGVAVGAHPGYPDLMGFGRRAMAVNPGEAKAYMIYQLGALQAFVIVMVLHYSI